MHLLDGLRVRNTLHEADLLCDCDALVYRKLEVKVDLFQQDVHQLEQDKYKLVLPQVITVFVDDAVRLHLRQGLMLALIDLVTELARSDLEENRLDGRAEDCTLVGFHTIVLDLGIERRRETFLPQVGHKEIALLILKLRPKSLLLRINLKTF